MIKKTNTLSWCEAFASVLLCLVVTACDRAAQEPSIDVRTRSPKEEVAPERKELVARLSNMCASLAKDVEAESVLLVSTRKTMIASSAPGLSVGDESGSKLFEAGPRAYLVVRISGKSRRALEDSIAHVDGASAEPMLALASAVMFAEKSIDAYVSAVANGERELPLSRN